MNLIRTVTMAASVAATLVVAQPLRAQTTSPATTAAVLLPIDTFISAILSNSPNEMPASFASSSSILDDLPPNVYTGPHAYADWYAAFLATNAKQKIAFKFLAHGSPHYLHVSGDRAYVVLPSDFTYVLGGKTYAESGTWTFGLVKQAGAWKIASWAWGLLTDTAE